MNLTDKDFKQIDEKYLSSLSLEELQALSQKLLEDLRASRDSLNMNPENSSCPSGSQPPWWKAEGKEEGLSEESESGSETDNAERGVEEESA